MSRLEAKYNLLVSQGWTPALPLPFVDVPVGDGIGTWFTWATTTGAPMAVYDNPSVGTFEVHGAILADFLAQSGPLGALGYPISDEGPDSAGRVSEFQFGSIFWMSATGQTTTMITGPVVHQPGDGVWFGSFLNTGVGLTGRPLGPTAAFLFIQNAVELQFEIDPSVHATHRDLRPMQWAGPEAVWVKQGDPGTSAWSLLNSNDGAGADAPAPENVFSSPATIAYYDAPGPNLTMFLAPRCSRAWIVQNFTGWVVGDPVAGGDTERLSEVASWHSILNLADMAWDTTAPDWQRFAGSGAALGWVDTASH